MREIDTGWISTDTLIGDGGSNGIGDGGSAGILQAGILQAGNTRV